MLSLKVNTVQVLMCDFTSSLCRMLTFYLRHSFFLYAAEQGFHSHNQASIVILKYPHNNFHKAFFLL